MTKSRGGYFETRACAAEIRRLEQWSGAQPPQMQISAGAAKRAERKFIANDGSKSARQMHTGFRKKIISNTNTE